MHKDGKNEQEKQHTGEERNKQTHEQRRERDREQKKKHKKRSEAKKSFFELLVHAGYHNNGKYIKKKKIHTTLKYTEYNTGRTVPLILCNGLGWFYFLFFPYHSFQMCASTSMDTRG